MTYRWMLLECVTGVGIVSSLVTLAKTEHYITAQTDDNVIRFARAIGFLLGSWMLGYFFFKAFWSHWEPSLELLVALTVGTYQISVNAAALCRRENPPFSYSATKRMAAE